MYGRQQKPKKSETPTNNPFTCFYPHTKPDTERDWVSKPYYQIVSIDPATTNYAIRVERWYKNEQQIVPILFDKVNLVENENDIDNVYVNLTNYLDKYLDIFMECNYVICEKQMPINYNSLRIAQHTLSYFIVKLKDNEILPSIIELCPKLKGMMLGAPKKMSYVETKNWATSKCIEILEQRGDTTSLLIFNKTKKKDDLADTVCQAKALFVYLKLDFGDIKKDEEFMESKKSLYIGVIPVLKVTKPRKKAEKKVVEPKMIFDEVDGNGIPKNKIMNKEKVTKIVKPRKEKDDDTVKKITKPRKTSVKNTEKEKITYFVDEIL